MKQKLIYFASPYTSNIPMLVARRYVEIRDIVEKVLLQIPGIVPFSPIAYTHQFGHLNIDWLQRADYRFLDACDAILVVQIEGYDKSEGMATEITYATENLIPVFYATPDEVIDVCQQIARL